MGHPINTRHKRALPLSETLENSSNTGSSRHSKRRCRIPDLASTTSLASSLSPKIPGSISQHGNSSAKRCEDSYTPVYLLSLPEARAILKGSGAAKGRFSSLPISDRLYTVVGMHSGRIPSALPRGEHYALIDGKLGRIKLVGEGGRTVQS